MMLSGTNLACIRGGLPIFQDVNFAIGAGQALLVTGPNGSGKTTLLRLIAGLIRPAKGHVTLAGLDPEASMGKRRTISPTRTRSSPP